MIAVTRFERYFVPSSRHFVLMRNLVPPLRLHVKCAYGMEAKLSKAYGNVNGSRHHCSAHEVVDKGLP